MNTYQKELIEEHSGLIIRIKTLHEHVYSNKSNDDDRIEFANKCIQLAFMKKYEEALRARLNNTGITFNNNQYSEIIGEINPFATVDTISDKIKEVKTDE